MCEIHRAVERVDTPCRSIGDEVVFRRAFAVGFFAEKGMGGIGFRYFILNERFDICREWSMRGILNKRLWYGRSRTIICLRHDINGIQFLDIVFYSRVVGSPPAFDAFEKYLACVLRYFDGEWVDFLQRQSNRI